MNTRPRTVKMPAAAPTTLPVVRGFPRWDLYVDDVTSEPQRQLSSELDVTAASLATMARNGVFKSGGDLRQYVHELYPAAPELLLFDVSIRLTIARRR